MKADKDIAKEELIALIMLQEKLRKSADELEKLLETKGNKKYALQHELMKCKSAINRMQGTLHWNILLHHGWRDEP